MVTRKLLEYARRAEVSRIKLGVAPAEMSDGTDGLAESQALHASQETGGGVKKV